MENPSQRTLVCSVIFLDIVGYSKQPVTQQLAWKEHLNALVTDAVSTIDEKDRIILDTGDGAALSILGSPEDALLVALKLVNSVIDQSAINPGFEVRTGVNLGSVRLIKDVNGMLNVVGDAINVAQRIMSFAGPREACVARSFYDVVSCLSYEYSQLFAYRGLFKDKHVREHEVYDLKYRVAAEPHTTDATIDKNALGWEPSAVEPITTLFARSVGPLAKILVKKALRESANPDVFVASLAEHISDKKQRQQFEAQVQPLIPTVARAERISPELQASSAQRAYCPAPNEVSFAERELALIIGPMAKVLVKKSAAASSSLEDFHGRLAVHIDTPRERELFLARVSLPSAKS